MSDNMSLPIDILPSRRALLDRDRRSPIAHYDVLQQYAEYRGDNDQASVWGWAKYHCIRFAEVGEK